MIWLRSRDGKLAGKVAVDAVTRELFCTGVWILCRINEGSLVVCAGLFDPVKSGAAINPITASLSLDASDSRRSELQGVGELSHCEWFGTFLVEGLDLIGDLCESCDSDSFWFFRGISCGRRPSLYSENILLYVSMLFPRVGVYF